MPSVGGREEGGLGLAGWNILCLDVGGATAWSAELRDGHVGGGGGCWRELLAAAGAYRGDEELADLGRREGMENGRLLSHVP